MQIIENSKRKFRGEFVELQFLQQLSYFDDLDIVPVDYIGNSFTADHIKSYLEKEVKQYTEKILRNA